jgi:hypothetical protein
MARSLAGADAVEIYERALDDDGDEDSPYAD